MLGPQSSREWGVVCDPVTSPHLRAPCLQGLSPVCPVTVVCCVNRLFLDSSIFPYPSALDFSVDPLFVSLNYLLSDGMALAHLIFSFAVTLFHLSDSRTPCSQKAPEMLRCD